MHPKAAELIALIEGWKDDFYRPIEDRPEYSFLTPIFPNEAAITRLVGAILLEQNDEWAVQRARYMTLETIAPLPR